MRWILIVCMTLTLSCQKLVEQTAVSIITDLILDYDWYMGVFKVNSTVETEKFEDFIFDFRTTDRVAALRNEEEYLGVWNANTSLLTIESYFEQDIPALVLLSRTWKIVGTTTTKVRAESMDGSTKYYMELLRKD